MSEMVGINILKKMVTPVEIILEDIGYIGRKEAEKILGQLMKNVIEEIPKEYNNFEINDFIIYFASMIHICDSYDIDVILEKYDLEKDLSIIYNEIEKSELVEYLKIIEEDMYDIINLNKAIKIYDIYELPYYMKIILYLEREGVKTVEDINKLQNDIKKDILYSYNKTDALRSLLHKEVMEFYFGKGESPLRLVDEVIDCDFSMILKALQ